MKIVLLTRSLEQGGAERQLVLLARGLQERGHRVFVLTFYGGGFFSRELESAGVPVISLGKRGRWDITGFLCRLIRRLRETQPEVLYSFLPVPNQIASLVKPLFPRLRLVWGLRVSLMDISQYDWLTRWVYWLESRLSHLPRSPSKVIVNSEGGRDLAINRGFPPEKLVVVLNGIDSGRFQPQPDAGRALRAEWGVSEDEFLVGHVGRLDPMKDHPTFLRAAAVFAGKGIRPWEKASFVCVGGGPEAYRARLEELTVELGLDGVVHWAGARTDLPEIYNALDVFTLSSIGEGFPNVVGEAMACEVPCVVTDVGDAARIVGESGWIVPTGSPEALAGAWLEVAMMNSETGRDKARRGRAHILENFTLSRMIEETEDCLSTL